MPPCTEKIHLSEQQVTLFIRSNERLDVRNTHITFTDAVPRTFPERKTVTIQPALTIVIPVSIVTQINLVIYVRIAFGVVNSIVAHIPSATVVHLLLVRNQVIDFLNISLEIAVVLKCLVLCHNRLRILIKPVGARNEGSTATQKEQCTA